MDSDIIQPKAKKELSPEAKALFESWLAAAEPLPDDAEELITYDKVYDKETQARVKATFAKRALEGKLQSDFLSDFGNRAATCPEVRLNGV